MIHQDIVVLLDDPSPTVRASLLSGSPFIFNILRTDKLFDAWLPHISTYLNDSGTMLKSYVYAAHVVFMLISAPEPYLSAICTSISYIPEFISRDNLEHFVLPILLQLVSG